MKVLVVVAIMFSAAPVFAQYEFRAKQPTRTFSLNAPAGVAKTNLDAAPPATDSKPTQATPTTTRQDVVTRLQLGDGTSFDWRTTSSVTRSNQNSVQTTVDTVEKDRQGVARTTTSSSTTVTKTPQGEQSSTVNYRRDASGRLITESEVTGTTTKNPNGSTSTVQVEKRAGLDGNMRPVRQVEATTVSTGGQDAKTTRRIQTYDHLENRFAVTAQETTQVRVEGDATRSETRVQKPSGAGWDDEARIVTTETKRPDGSVRREIIEEGRSLYAKQSGTPSSVEPLQPQRKIVEQEVRQPDGTAKVERQVFRRDINGEWRPATFTTDGAPGAH
jgi:hypothetical protein